MLQSIVYLGVFIYFMYMNFKIEKYNLIGYDVFMLKIATIIALCVESICFVRIIEPKSLVVFGSIVPYLGIICKSIKRMFQLQEYSLRNITLKFILYHIMVLLLLLILFL